MAQRWLTLALLLALAGPAPALELSGTFRQGGWAIGRTDPANRVYFAGDRVRLGPNGSFVIGFGRQAPARLPLAIVRPDDSYHQRQLAIEQRDYGVQRIDGLSEEMVTPDEELLARIHRDQERVARARGHFRPGRSFHGDLRWPVQGPITGVYGTRRVLNGEPRQPHYGVDIAVPAGTPVHAPAAGVVRLAAPDLYFSGGTLIIDHGQGLSSSFLHLQRILVDAGERVRRGQPVARVGATGRSTGAHLDWRVNWFDKRLDPALLAGPMPDGTRVGRAEASP